MIDWLIHGGFRNLVALLLLVMLVAILVEDYRWCRDHRDIETHDPERRER